LNPELIDIVLVDIGITVFFIAVIVIVTVALSLLRTPTKYEKLSHTTRSSYDNKEKVSHTINENMFGERWRTKQELWYLAKHQLNQSPLIVAISGWTVSMLMASLYVRTTWAEDFPNWYAAILSVYFGILIAMIAYFKSKKSQEDIEIRVKRIEGMLSSKFDLEKNHPKTSQFYLSLALNGIINTFPEIENLSKKWKKIKSSEQKIPRRKRELFLEKFHSSIWVHFEES